MKKISSDKENKTDRGNSMPWAITNNRVFSLLVSPNELAVTTHTFGPVVFPHRVTVQGTIIFYQSVPKESLNIIPRTEANNGRKIGTKIG